MHLVSEHKLIIDENIHLHEWVVEILEVPVPVASVPKDLIHWIILERPNADPALVGVHLGHPLLPSI